MLFPPDAITALQDAFGYTECEARFLYVVGTFSGHFFRRHYRTFSGAARGKRDDTFVQKLLGHGHVTGYEWNSRTVRFHLSHRRIYRLIGREHSNNRKQSSNALINVRLAGLDYVLDNLDAHFLGDEQQRVSFFVDLCGAPEAVLPRALYRPRHTGGTSSVSYFVDRFPLAIQADPATGEQTPTFTYVDEPTQGLAAFRTYLTQYAPLFSALSRPFTVVFVSSRDAKIQAAEPVFRGTLSASHAATPGLDGDVLRYFTLKDRWDRKDFAGVTKQDHIDRAHLRDHYETPAYRELYRRWHEGALDIASPPPGALVLSRATFRSYYARSLA